MQKPWVLTVSCSHVAIQLNARGVQKIKGHQLGEMFIQGLNPLGKWDKINRAVGNGVGQGNPADELHVKRLRYYKRLLQHCPPALWHLLHALELHPDSWLASLRGSLRWLATCLGPKCPLDPASALDDWWSFIILDDRWHSRVKRAQKACLAFCREEAKALVWEKSTENQLQSDGALAEFRPQSRNGNVKPAAIALIPRRPLRFTPQRLMDTEPWFSILWWMGLVLLVALTFIIAFAFVPICVRLSFKLVFHRCLSISSRPSMLRTPSMLKPWSSKVGWERRPSFRLSKDLARRYLPLARLKPMLRIADGRWGDLRYRALDGRWTRTGDGFRHPSPKQQAHLDGQLVYKVFSDFI